MTEHLSDESLSATLDGDTNAHLGSCPRCSARVGELRRAADLIAAPGPPADPARREAAIAVALKITLLNDAVVVPLTSRRRQPPTWAWAAAAAVLVLAALVPLLNRDHRSNHETSAASTKQSAAPNLSAGAAGAGAVVAPLQAGDLGTVSPDQLGARVAKAMRGPRTATAPQPQSAGNAVARVDPPCRAELARANPSLGALRLVATATVAGRPASVLVFDTSSGLRAYAVDRDDCGALLATAAVP